MNNDCADTVWVYCEPGDNGPNYVEMTEQDILDTYYPWWCSQMQRVGLLPMVTERNCIEDWTVVHWACRKDQL